MLQERLLDDEAQRLCSLEIDDQFEFGRQLHRQLAWLGSLKYEIDIRPRPRYVSAKSTPYDMKPPSLAKKRYG